ncbi:MAG: hypothetical protein QGF78_01710 [Candidatus Bathyarchaeota archaeon]|jgi:hypothetical protein|nr:hypothetical protein [Candidatus Bathyarchaeota archaeon]
MMTRASGQRDHLTFKVSSVMLLKAELDLNVLVIFNYFIVNTRP